MLYFAPSFENWEPLVSLLCVSGGDALRLWHQAKVLTYFDVVYLALRLFAISKDAIKPDRRFIISTQNDQKAIIMNWIP